MAPTIWTPEPIWRGRTVFVVGGGPSLKGFDFDRLRHRNVVALNAAGEDLPWADLLFFKSPDWRECRALIAGWRGIAATTSADPSLPASVWQVPRDLLPRARTSGQLAVSLAVRIGAARIVLLGFDWNREGGNYHDRYDRPGIAYRDVPPEVWGGYRRHAEQKDCEVLNATPGSSITEFPIVNPDEILCLTRAS